MKVLLLLLANCMFLSGYISGQIIYEDDFENGTAAGWTNETLATDGGWNIGTVDQLSSDAFTFSSNGSDYYAVTNDDACNCDKSQDRFISPAFDLTDVASAVFQFDLYFLLNNYQGSQEYARTEVSTNGQDWILVEELHGHSEWDTHFVDLSAYAGEQEVYVSFLYDDSGGWLYGCAIDNVMLTIPPAIDAALLNVENSGFGIVDEPIYFKGTIQNNGSSPIENINLALYSNGDLQLIETISDINIQSFDYYPFTLTIPWLPSVAGEYDNSLQVQSVNLDVDQIENNNTIEFTTEIFENQENVNGIEDLIAFEPIVVELETNMLDRPTDLDFFPINGKDQLWIVNQRLENVGGSTLIISDISTDNPQFEQKVDGNAWHFMSLPTGISFSSENYNFATSTGVQDANHSGGTFTGPTLWSSDPIIFAQPSGGNGSHLDMLHGSPQCMGITHEVDNVFWVYDDYNQDIVRYDFKDDHGPGNDDHSDGVVRRYEGIDLATDSDIPNHLILDKSSGWLYFTDNGNKRVLRLDINSGQIGNSIPLINEPLAEHSSIINYDYEEIVSFGLEQPCGIDIIDNYLLVGDYNTGFIFIYDTENDFGLMDIIQTGQAGLTGIKIAPDGSIYCVNREENMLLNIIPSNTVGIQNVVANRPLNYNFDSAHKQITIDVENAKDLKVQLINTLGQIVLSKTDNVDVLDVRNLQTGIYLISLTDKLGLRTAQLFIP